MELLDRYGMDESERRRRQRFLGLTDADADAVRSLRDVFARHAEEFAEQFYRHLLSDETAAAFLADPEQLQRLKRSQADYFAELLEGKFGAAYFEKRLRVGQTHQRVGLEPVFYLGAYNQYIQLTFPLFVQACGDDAARVLPALLSLVKVIFLDIGLALDTYFREATEQLRQRNEELQKALSLYLQSQGRAEQIRKLLSHEVRGGLAAVITMLEDALDAGRDRLDPAVADSLQSAGKRCWSLTALLKEMLSSTHQGGPTWVETARIWEHLSGRFELYKEGRPFELILPEEAPRVWADPLQLREVFANLLANAIRYNDKPRGRITVSCRPVAGRERKGHPEGEFILFGVADNGPGIPAEIEKRLFEPFVRGKGEARSEGTGLGLYFVRAVVEQGGGRVWVESTPGVGTTFWFTVPAAPVAVPGD
jgi:signal transduction histidine kinase